MDTYRDPQTEHIDSIRDWHEFLEVTDAWENVTSSYWDVDHPPELYSISGRYGWWATILAKWIVENSKVSPEPMLAITRMIQAKDPLGDMREFAATPDDIHRKRYEWRPYRHLLIGQAECAIAGNEKTKIKPTPETLKIIRLIEKGLDNERINEKTGSSVGNVRKVRSVLNRNGYEL
jgi:hypothetical protein